MDSSSRPIFLGICEKALIRGEGLFQDFYGAGEMLVLPFLPQTLHGPLLLFAFPIEGFDSRKIKVTLQHAANPENRAWIDVDISSVPSRAAEKVNLSSIQKHFSVSSEQDGAYPQVGSLLMRQGCSYKLIPIPAPPLLVTEPGTYEVIVESNDESYVAGMLDIIFTQPPPISDAERAALKSEPESIKAIRIQLACKKCKDELNLYEQLDNADEPSKELKALTPLRDAPASWRCECEETDIPLKYLKAGIPHLLRQKPLGDRGEQIGFLPRYEQGAVDSILEQYHKLINSRPRERLVQEFLEANPILWNFLAPCRIWPEPRILAKYETDFAILTHSGILFIIEIEKPQTKLVKRKGGIHHELTKGLDQLCDWRVMVQDHRCAVLEYFGLLGRTVDIRYMLIAGLSYKTQTDHLLKLKRNPSAADVFFCFDELAPFLQSTKLALAKL